MSQLRHGFRAGLDSVLLGAAGQFQAARLLDLGAGVGTAALVALALGRAETATLVESHAPACALARRNIAENGFAGRAELLAIDLLDRPAERRAAGLADNRFDTIIANPPFFGMGKGTMAPDAGRAAARHMADDGLESWMRCAAGCAAKGGEAILIYPASGLAALLAVFTPRFGAITVLPLSPRPGLAAKRVLVRGVKGSRAPLRLLASRALHGADGRAFSPEFAAIFLGEAALAW